MLDIEMLSPGESVYGPISEAADHVPQRRHGGHRSGVAGPEDLEQLTKNDHACRALWSAVIIHSAKDLYKIGTVHTPSRKYGNNIQYHRSSSAKAWFESESQHPGSFRWICHYLGFSADAILRSLLSHDADWLKSKTRLLYVLGEEGRGNSLQ